MIYKLQNIVKIKSGVFAKGDVNPDLYYIQSTDFNKQLEWGENLNYILAKSDKFKHHILSKGDILFAAKGKAFFAVVYDQKFAPAVASSTFLVLQLQTSLVVPEYIAWFLNHPKTQTQLLSLARGTAISSISKSTLEQIEIPIPNLLKQKSILEISNLQVKEKILQRKIMKLKQEYLDELTYKSIQ